MYGLEDLDTIEIQDHGAQLAMIKEEDDEHPLSPFLNT